MLPDGRPAGCWKATLWQVTAKAPHARSDLVEGLSLGSAAQAEFGAGAIRVTMTDPSTSPAIADPHARSPMRSTSDPQVHSASQRHHVWRLKPFRSLGQNDNSVRN